MKEDETRNEVSKWPGRPRMKSIWSGMVRGKRERKGKEFGLEVSKKRLVKGRERSVLLLCDAVTALAPISAVGRPTPRCNLTSLGGVNL